MVVVAVTLQLFGSAPGMSELTIFKAIANLNKLLCANIEHLSDQEISTLVKKRYLQWHPDKNPDNPNLYREQFQTLFQSYEFYKEHKNGANSQTDSGQFSADSDFDFEKFKNMYCDEEMFSSEDEDYNNTGFDDQFFTPSPTKDFKVPDSHRGYFRSRSNRRAGKYFAIYCKNTELEKLQKLYEFKYEHISTYFCVFLMRNDSTFVTLLSTIGEFRLLDVKKNLKAYKINPHDLYYCVKFKDFIHFLNTNYDFQFLGRDDLGGPTRKVNPIQFNHLLICEYAMSHKIDNVMKLMVEYSHLATPCCLSPSKVTNDHLEDHKEHKENAISFKHLSDRKRAAQNAVQTVVAELFVEISKEEPHKYIDRRSRELSDIILEQTDPEFFGLAWFYSHYHIPSKKFNNFAKLVLNSFIYGTPRLRWTIFQGDYKSGKTSFSSAFTEFFEGVTININVDKNRLSFFLGNALGKRFVLFDDVKGRVDNKRKSLLTSGNGFQNLDDLRDHLDGHVKVQLEKKNQQPVEQKFPPGIITCNKYVVEPALLERVQGPIKFRESKYWSYHDLNVTKETIFVGCVLHNLLPVEPHVHEYIIKKVFEWQQHHDRMCDCLQVSLFTFIMGAALGVLLGAAGTAWAYITFAATAAASYVSAASIYFGLIAADAVYTASFSAPLVLTLTTVAPTTYSLTALGASILGLAATATVLGIAGGIYGYSLGHTPKVLPQPSVDDILNDISDPCGPYELLKLDGSRNDWLQCWESSGQAMRLDNRKKRYRSLPSTSEESVFSRKTKLRRSSQRGPSKGRKVDAKAKRMRSKNIK